MSFDWNSYREGLNPDDLIWDSPTDLARLSMSTFIAEQSPVRRDSSSGYLRLLGPGVHGHSASLTHVAGVMTQFQRLVLASGLALAGWKTSRGRAPADVVARTKLLLDGSAAPGSLVLQMVPAALPAEEIMPSGQGEFFREDDNQVVDNAMGRSIDLLNLGKATGPDADSSPFLTEVKASGPRVAAALRDFAKDLASGGFEADILWAQPRVKPRRSRLSVGELSNVAALVASRELEKEPVTLEGVLRTVSDIGPLKLEIAPGEYEDISAKNIPGAVIAGLNVGDRVKVLADVTEEVSAGGESKVKYRATQVTVL